jgi:hypothetical protein
MAPLDQRIQPNADSIEGFMLDLIDKLDFPVTPDSAQQIAAMQPRQVVLFLDPGRAAQRQQRIV